jgi:hypothetical protein
VLCAEAHCTSSAPRPFCLATPGESRPAASLPKQGRRRGSS